MFKKALELMILEINCKNHQPYCIQARSIFLMHQFILIAQILALYLIEQSQQIENAYSMLEIIVKVLLILESETLRMYLQGLFLIIAIFQIVWLIYIWIQLVRQEYKGQIYQGEISAQFSLSGEVFGHLLIIGPWILMPIICQHSTSTLASKPTEAYLYTLAWLNIVLQILLTCFYTIYSLQSLDQSNHNLFINYGWPMVLWLVLNISANMVFGAYYQSHDQLLQKMFITHIILLDSLYCFNYHFYSVAIFVQEPNAVSFYRFSQSRLVIYPLLIIIVLSDDPQYNSTAILMAILMFMPLLIKVQLLVIEKNLFHRSLKVQARFVEYFANTEPINTTQEQLINDCQLLMKMQSNKLFANSLIIAHCRQCTDVKCSCSAQNPIFDELLKYCTQSTDTIQLQRRSEILFSENVILYLRLIMKTCKQFIDENTRAKSYKLVLFLNQMEYHYQPFKIFQIYIRCQDTKVMNLAARRPIHHNSYLQCFMQRKNRSSLGRLNPRTINVFSHRLAAKRKITTFLVNQQKFAADLAQVQQYEQITLQAGVLELYLIDKKSKLLHLLCSNTQDPHPFMLEKMFKKYIGIAQLCEKHLMILTQLNCLNYHTIVLGSIFYGQLMCCQNTVKYFQSVKHFEPSKMSHDHITILNRQNSQHTVLIESIVKGDRLFIQRHSADLVNFFWGDDPTARTMSFVDKPIDYLLPEFMIKPHQQFVQKFIETGKPHLIVDGILTLYYQKCEEYIQECHSLLRADQYEMNALKIITFIAKMQIKFPIFLTDANGYLQAYNQSASEDLKLGRLISVQINIRRMAKVANLKRQSIIHDFNIYQFSPMFHSNLDEDFEFSQSVLVIPIIYHIFIANEIAEITLFQIQYLQQISNGSKRGHLFLCDGRLEKRNIGSYQINILNIYSFKEITGQSQRAYYANQLIEQYCAQSKETSKNASTYYIGQPTDRLNGSRGSIDSIEEFNLEPEVPLKVPLEQRHHVFPNDSLPMETSILNCNLAHQSNDLQHFLSPTMSQKQLLTVPQVMVSQMNKTINEVEEPSPPVERKQSIKKVVPRGFQQHQDDLFDQSSIGSSKVKESKAIDAEIRSFIERKPRNLVIMLLVGILGITATGSLVVVNLLNVEDNYMHLTEDSINRMMPDTWLQAVNLYTCAIENLNYLNRLDEDGQPNQRAILQKYLAEAYVEYYNITITTFHYEKERHEHIWQMDELGEVQFLTANDLDPTKSEIVNFSLIYFFKEQLLNKLYDSTLVNQREIDVLAENEGFILLNLNNILKWSVYVEDLTRVEAIGKRDEIFLLLILMMVLSVIFSLIFAVYLIWSVFSVLRSQHVFIQAYFLFQKEDLIRIITKDLPEDTAIIANLQIMGETKPLVQQNETAKMREKQQLSKRLKTKARNKQQELNLKRRYLLSYIAIMVLISVIGIVYFLPFYAYINNAFIERFQMNDLIFHLSLTVLNISTRLSRIIHMIAQETFPDSYQQYHYNHTLIDERLTLMKASEDFITLEMPFDSFYTDLKDLEIQQLIHFTTDNFCDIYFTDDVKQYLTDIYSFGQDLDPFAKWFDRHICLSIYQRGLTKGYKSYVSKIQDSVLVWEQEIFGKGFNEQLAKSIVLSAQYHEILTSHFFIAQYFAYLKRQLVNVLHSQTSGSVTVFTSISYVALLLILLGQSLLLLLVNRSLQRKYKLSAQVMLIFGHRLVKCNKHLIKLIGNR